LRLDGFRHLNQQPYHLHRFTSLSA
jgi:hypothetical protein